MISILVSFEFAPNRFKRIGQIDVFAEKCNRKNVWEYSDDYCVSDVNARAVGGAIRMIQGDNAIVDVNLENGLKVTRLNIA